MVAVAQRMDKAPKEDAKGADTKEIEGAAKPNWRNWQKPFNKVMEKCGKARQVRPLDLAGTPSTLRASITRRDPDGF